MCYDVRTRAYYQRPFIQDINVYMFLVLQSYNKYWKSPELFKTAQVCGF